MENNKNNSPKVVILFSIIGIIILLIIVGVLFHFISSSKNSENVPMQIVPTKPVVILPTAGPLITPTTVPSAKSGWKTFTFSNPATPYSFEYPSTWGVVEIGHDNIVRLNFAGHCNLEFSTKNNDERNGSNSQTKETRTIAERCFSVTSFQNSEIYSLSDATSKDGFSLITVNLPYSNKTQCQQTVDQILASLTFGQ